MSIRGDKLIELDPTDFFEKYQPTKCRNCGAALHETTTGCRFVKKGCICSDCYYKALSAEIDKHSIYLPRIHRGG
jgi:hypothetical protein